MEVYRRPQVTEYPLRDEGIHVSGAAQVSALYAGAGTMCSVADDQLPSEIGEPGRAESATQFISEFLEDLARER